MIRRLNRCDMGQVMQIWLNGNIEAHSFVPQEYWESNLAMVREQLLQAEVFVYEENGAVLGFVGMQGNYLAGIFVEKSARSMGVGKQLLDYIKRIHPVFCLNVYQKNRRAVAFYQREGLIISAEGVDEGTGKLEYTMEWTQKQRETFQEMLRYRKLYENEIDRKLFAGFIRRQDVTWCWRKEGGTWVIRNDPFVDDWTEADYRALIAHLRTLISGGGVVYGVFCQGSLKGFASVAPALFGREKNYMDLTNIHVSRDMRNQGIGTALFMHAKKWARQNGAGRLYISAHSAVESQAFYKKMGCVEAEEYCQKHVEEEPYDCQLECRL